jgi:hypothetical protein
VLHLVDARHPELAADLEAAKWLQSLDVARSDPRDENRQAVT